MFEADGVKEDEWEELVENDDAFRGRLWQIPVVCRLTQTSTARSASQTPAAHYSKRDRCGLSSE